MTSSRHVVSTLFNMHQSDFELPDSIRVGNRLYRVSYRSDKVDIEAMIREDYKLRRIFQQNIRAERWVNNIMNEAVRSNSFVVFQYKGMSNSGKSWAAIQMARILRAKWLRKGIRNPRILFAKHWGHALNLLDAEGCGVGDHIITDEESYQSGEHSATDANAISNILRATRAKGICYSFLDPEPRPKPNVDVMFRIIGTIKDAWTTWMIAYSPRGNPVGLIYLKIPGQYRIVGYDDKGYEIRRYLNPDWAEIMSRYEPLKMKNIDAMVKMRGLAGSDLAEMKSRYARQLYEFAMRQGLKPTTRRLRLYLSKMGLSKLPYATREDVITECKDIIAREGVKMMITEKDERGTLWDLQEVKTVPIDVTKVLTPDGPMMRYLEQERVKHNRLSRKKIKREHLEWWRLWCLGVSQQEIANDNNTNQMAINRAINRVRESILGYATEDWVAEKHPDWIHRGGNTPEPDFESDTHIISVKGRCRANPQWSIKSFGALELQRALETGKELQLWYFEFKYEPRLIVLRAVPRVRDDVDEEE